MSGRPNDHAESTSSMISLGSLRTRWRPEVLDVIEKKPEEVKSSSPQKLGSQNSQETVPPANVQAASASASQ